MISLRVCKDFAHWTFECWAQTVIMTIMGIITLIIIHLFIDLTRWDYWSQEAHFCPRHILYFTLQGSRVSQPVLQCVPGISLGCLKMFDDTVLEKQIQKQRRWNPMASAHLLETYQLSKSWIHCSPKGSNLCQFMLVQSILSLPGSTGKNKSRNGTSQSKPLIVLWAKWT